MNLYNLMAWTNNKLFDGIKLPDQVDNETLVSTIMGLYGEYEPIISDPDYFRYQLDYYFRRRFNDFKAIVDALEMEYNPIENFDRFEDVTTQNNETKTNKYTSERTSDSDSLDKVSAFDTDSFSNDTQNITNNIDNITDNATDTINGSNTTTSHLHGNIGVTTSQQMLESEIQLRSKYNIYEIIAKMFFQEFMLQCL